ncbi:cistern family PEP-CTERM protein [Pseudanabaenaceae cyanobacterium LEGE 13415]|nr:cistern family PEP-CTERM protein [Pseudanabaenaceae cyanobacterium LEGE 13415]
MSKNLSPALLMLCSGVASLTLLVIANPAFAKANNGNGNGNSNSTTQTQTPTQTQPQTPTQTVVAPTQSATPTTSSFTLGLADLGKIFRINFDGNVGGSNVSNLSSFVDLTFKGFTTQNGNTIATFDALLDNTSSGDVLSRVSGFGFNTGATLIQNSTAASGVFDKAHLGGSFPNQFGNIDVCFNTGNTCQGGTSGGVNNSTSLPGTFDSGKFSFTLALSGNVSTLSLSNFGVRYQSIDSKSLNLSGASGTGRGTYAGVVTPPVTTPPVTTPPVTTPPVTTPPVTTPPVTTPPVTTPPVTTPPVTTPPVTTPPLFNTPIDGTKPNDPPNTTPPIITTPPPKVTTPKPAKVPEPSTIAALTLVGAIALKYRKKQETESEL